MAAAKQLIPPLLPRSSSSSSSSSSSLGLSFGLTAFRSRSTAPTVFKKRTTRKCRVAARWEQKQQLKKEDDEEEALSKMEKKRSSSLLRLKRRTRSVLGFDPRQWDDEDCHHVPVMLGEVLRVFARPQIRSFVDCTLGAAGHSSAIIRAHPEMQLYVGLDMDPLALELGRNRIEALLNHCCGDASSSPSSQLRAYTHLRNFKYIKSVLDGVAGDDGAAPQGVDGILMDLGMSSMQVNNPQRGFSITGDGPLDMRMNPQASLKAEDILNLWPEAEVGRVLREYGEESNWRLLQRKILNARTDGGLHSTSELVDLIRRASPRSGGRQGWMKTAIRVFQALRITVNDELKTLEDALYACFDCLLPGGRLAVISFHSLEDRIVKRTFLDIVSRDDEDGDEEQYSKRRVDDCILEEEAWCKGKIRGNSGTILTKRPITPPEEEEKLNPRCRSAKLRVVQKT